MKIIKRCRVAKVAVLSTVKGMLLFPYYISIIYRKLWNYEGIVNKYIREELGIINLRNLSLNSDQQGISKRNAGQRLIVSLTSHPMRVNDVFLVVESLFQQTLRPDKIILWLDENQFSKDNIPEMLKKAENRGLEIGFCKDIKSYTKLIPTLKRYPNDLIITVDDDMVYPCSMVEGLYKSYQEDPEVIHCHLGHRIRYDAEGKIICYNKWDRFSSVRNASLDIFPTGVSGVLYFPGCFHEDIMREDLFLELAPHADDVWFKAMTLLKNVKCKIVQSNQEYLNLLFPIPGTQVTSLWSSNKYEESGNNCQIEAVFSHYDIDANVLNLN